MAAQAIGAAVNVQFDGQLHPNFEGIESIWVDMWNKRFESSADDCTQSGAGISSEGVCELYQPVFLSALLLHTSTECSHSFQCCHIGIGSSLQQKSHPRHRVETLLQLGSGAMVSDEQANEIAATEQNLMKDLFNRA